MSSATKFEPVSLREWISNNWDISDQMRWKSPYHDQLAFARDQISALMSSNPEHYKSIVQVVGTHRSKSIECPVYAVHLYDNGVKIWMRYNFFNWNISVDSDIPIACDFMGCFNDEQHGYCFCEGMEEYRFGPYRDNISKFTVCISDKYEVYVFFRVLRKFLNIQWRG